MERQVKLWREYACNERDLHDIFLISALQNRVSNSRRRSSGAHVPAL
jgi:hypothetical protein